VNPFKSVTDSTKIQGRILIRIELSGNVKAFGFRGANSKWGERGYNTKKKSSKEGAAD